MKCFIVDLSFAKVVTVAPRPEVPSSSRQEYGTEDDCIVTVAGVEAGSGPDRSRFGTEIARALEGNRRVDRMQGMAESGQR